MTAPVPPGLERQLEMIAERVLQRYISSGPLRNASITGGGLTIQNGTLRILYPEDQGGGAAVYYGNLVDAVTGDYIGTGMLMQKPDGTDIASFSWDATGDTQTAHLHDDENNIIVSNNKAAGWGLSRPWVPGVFYARRFVDFRFSTTSPTFETLTDTVMPRQHAALQVGYRVSADASGTTGETRVLVDGTPVGPTTSETFSVATRYTGVQIAPAGAHYGSATIEIQARVTAGTGALKVEPLYLYGREN